VRSRVIKPQYVTVHPLRDQSAQIDAFGDAPLVTSGGGPARESSFRVKMQIEWGSTSNYAEAVPGRQSSYTAEALVLKRHIPPSANGWEPEGGDLLILVSGRHLFVGGVELDFPRRVSKNHPDGGWDGWRLRLMDRRPSQSAATSYE